jgi:CHAT domain
MTRSSTRRSWTATAGIAVLLAGTSCVTRPVPPPPPPPERGIGEPVYNVLLQPHSQARRNVIARDVTTKVTFYIGPEDPDSALPASEMALSPEALAQLKRTPLLVTMTCGFCASENMQQQRLSYDAEAGVSSKAVFSIRVAEKWRNRDNATLIFSISADGIELDRVDLPIRVVPNLGASGSTAAPGHELSNHPGDAARLADGAAAAAAAPGGKPDVVLRVAQDINGLLTVSAEAVGAEVSQALASMGNPQKTPAGTPRVFPTSNFTVPELASLELDQYLKIKSIVEQNDKIASAVHPEKDVPKFIPVSVDLPVDAGQALLEQFCDPGQFLYAKLFAVQDIQDIVAALEDLKLDRPLRIRIDSINIYAPWQYLHPTGECNAEGFWGFKFEITSNPIIPLPGGLPLTKEWVKRLSTVLFLGFKGDTPEDQVRRYAATQAKDLEEALTPRKVAVRIADNSGDFTRELKDLRTTIGLLVIFAHAATGYVVQTPDGGIPTLAEDLVGPRVILGPKDFVSAKEVFKLRNQLPKTVKDVLEEHPLVFLNACETGAIGVAPRNALGFPGTFLELGARAVVVTEAPVWILFGHRFGTELSEAVIAGERPSLALLKLRQKYLGGNNPLGLLYTYYGDGISTFKQQ